MTLLSLGFWQIYRLSWKLDLIEQIENSLKNDPVELSNIEKKNYLRIKTSGEIDFDKQMYLYNLNDTGKPGFEVINPIKTYIYGLTKTSTEVFRREIGRDGRI